MMIEQRGHNFLVAALDSFMQGGESIGRKR